MQRILLLEQGGGEVAVAGVGQQGHDGLALVLRALGQLDGGPEGGTGGDAHQNALGAADFLAGGEGRKTELKQEQAVKLITEFLSDGKKVSIAEINKEAAERGISERTVRLARNSMGEKIASERQGKDWWVWFKS